MSDLTALSQEYAESATFSESVNADVMALKKARIRSTWDSAAVREVRSRLATLLKGIATALGPGEPEEGVRVEHIPQEILERLEEAHRAHLPYFVDDARIAAKALLAGGAPSDESVAMCDELCEAADATASASFRRLRRR